MKKDKFNRLLNKGKVVILDGSTGVALQKKGMPKGVCPEQWAIDNKQQLLELQREYVDAGSMILYTFTFGGNPVKLSEFGLKDRTFEINKKLAEISGEAAAGRALVAGDIAPTGHFPEPFGEVPFEDMVNCFKEQVKGLLAGGVDLFVIETMLDIQEARAALLAVKESCNLPVMVSMTFDNGGKTLMGTDPAAALVTLQSLGADVVGVNCSTGPKEMIDVIKTMKPHARVPLLAKPNAGLPGLVNGQTVFDMDAGSFCAMAKPLVEAGATLIGGCCGTSPDFIKQTALQVKGMKAPAVNKNMESSLSSARMAIFPGKDRFILIGERINPTGKKQLQSELKEGMESEVRRFAFEQAQKGASILDVNVGMPGIDEKIVMLKTIKMLGAVSPLPLCIDSSAPEVIEAALRVYPGKALINSISGEKHKYEKMLPLAAKYGAMFILLPLDDRGIPGKSIDRVRIVKTVAAKAKKAGIGPHEIAVDGLVMTVSADRKAAVETLNVILQCSKKLKLNTVIGLSNVSFGLPGRQIINSTFLNMAKDKGLTMAIANPAMDLSVRDPDAELLLQGRDANAKNFIAKYAVLSPNAQNTKSEEVKTAGPDPYKNLQEAVIRGETEGIDALVNAALQAPEKHPAATIVDMCLIAAINEVGQKYEKKEYFLPQLIQSAEAMKKAFAVLAPLLEKTQGDRPDNAKTVVLATVKGDIHDIGKNIVALMLRNYGFTVHDLGKDIDEYTIVRKAKETGAQIIALSALMTTTMIEMPKVIELAKKEGLNVKFMIGGAVVTQSYADEIGADGYSKDAYDAVRLAQRLSGKQL
ncbi:MAG: homocysteine S-methyltransferase family protein [Spirochaetia bacterium]|nr:homocysteine S-methyltransferase family protein [Spirochaetia bacterium]